MVQTNSSAILAEVDRLRQDGKTFTQIAELLGHTKGWVAGICRRLRQNREKVLSRPPEFWNDERTAHARALIETGMSTYAVAKALGGDHAAYKQLRRLRESNKLGLDLSKLPRTVPQKQKRTIRREQSERERLATARAEAARAPEPRQLADDPDSLLDFSRTARAVAMLDMTTCRWPIGDTGTDAFTFCCHEVEAIGKPYCPHHARKAYNPDKPRRL